MGLPPGPSQPAFVQSVAWLLRPVQVMESCAAKYGDAFTLRWVGYGNLVFLTSPDLIREVFTGDPKVLHAGEGNAIIEPLVGKRSLFILDEDEHLRQRRLLLPAFHGERMQTYATSMRDITDRAINTWSRSRPFSLHHEMSELTLEVIVRTVFGIEEAEQLRDILVTLHRLLDFIGSRASDFLTLLPSQDVQRFVQVDLGPRSPWGSFLRVRKAVDDALYAEIARRRASGQRGSSVLSLLLDARDENGQPMTDLELRDELMTLLLAGHETTAAALAWAFENILANPTIEARCMRELREHAPDGLLTHAQLAKMTYIDAVAKEALRLRPILQIVARRLKAPLRVGPWDLPTDTVVAPCTYLTQRRPEIFPEPDRFDPDRFIDGKPTPYQFLPFGGGIRRCIGASFALYQMKVVIATVLARTKLRLVGKPGGVKRRTVTLVPASGTKVEVLHVATRMADAPREATAPPSPSA